MGLCLQLIITDVNANLRRNFTDTIPQKRNRSIEQEHYQMSIDELQDNKYLITVQNACKRYYITLIFFKNLKTELCFFPIHKDFSIINKYMQGKKSVCLKIQCN